MRRLTRRCIELRQAISSEQLRLVRLHDARLNAMRGTAPYQSKQTDLAAVSRDLAIARAAHDSNTAMPLSSRLNHLRQDLDQMDSAAIAGDPQIAQSAVLVRDDDAQLAALDSSLTSAKKWRADVVDAIRNSFILTWPLRKGQIGLLGETRSTDALRRIVQRTHGAQMAALLFDGSVLGFATEWRQQTEEHEKITINKVVQHPFLIQIDGGAAPETDMVVEVAVVDEDSPAATAIGREIGMTVVIARPDHPLTELMRAINAP